MPPEPAAIARPSRHDVRRFFFVAMIAPLLLAACVSRTTPRPAAADAATALRQPADVIVGRIVTVDTPARTAIVRLVTWGRLPESLAGRDLVARRDDLTPTARLSGTVHRRDRILGVRIQAGSPAPGDEVVLLSATAPR